MSGRTRHWKWRVSAGVTAAAVLLTAIVVVRFGLREESRSPLLWSAAAIASVVGLVLGRVVLLSSEGIEACRDRLQSLRVILSDVDPQSQHVTADRLLIAAATAIAAGNLSLFLFQPDSPTDDDQAAYLATASAIHDAGGPTGLVAVLYSGEFDEANRHPLYLALLSLKPTETFGRGLSCLSGAAAFALAVAWSYRRLGPLPAGVFALLLAANSAWLFFSTRVYSESLLMLVSFGVWIAVDRLLTHNRTREGESASTARSWMPAFLTGSLLALCWLAKGTGLLLLAATLMALVMTRRTTRTSPTSTDDAGSIGRGSVRQTVSQLLLVLAGFVIVSSPLLLRNLRRFGTPFYNINSQLLFVDQYADPVALAAERTTGEAAREYWQTHTLAEMLWREAHGLVWETYILLRSLGPVPLDDARILFGLPLGLLAVVGAWTAQAYPAGLTAVWTITLWLVFAWYVPIAAGERFLVPVLIPILIAAANGGVRIWCVWRTGATEQAASELSRRQSE